jgi:tetratricopeptide (TPR) repeat protein
MKKLLLSVLLTALALGAYAQDGANAIDKVMQEDIKKTKEKSDKDITNEKLKTKAKTWQDRAKAYEQVALKYADLDSNAAWTAYEAYQQVIALDKDKNGGPGKMAQEAQKTIAGGGANELYYALLSQGGARYQRKNMEGALKYMQKASEVHPKDTTAALYTGVVAQQANKMDLAKASFSQFIELGGKDPEIFLNLASLYQNDKEIDKALQVVDKGIALNPSYKNLSNQKFNLLYASGRTDKAIEELKAQVEKNPNDVQSTVNLGILYGNAADQYSDEIRQLGERGRKDSSLKKRLEDAQEKEKTYAGEITRLSGRVKKEPKNAELKRQLTEVTKMQADAKEEIKKAQEEMAGLGSEDAGASAKIQELTAKQEEQSKLAMEYYQRALKVDPNNYDANFNIGVSYFNKAVITKRQVDGMDMKTYQEKGKAVEDQVVAQFKQAMPYFEKAYEVKQEAEVKDNLLNLYNVLKQLEKTEAYDAKIQKLSE